MTTQKDIADQLGLSPSLVSRALSGTAQEIGVREETIQRICAVAAKLHYRPSAAALTLRGAPTKTLGVIVKSFQDPFFGHLVGELQTLAWEKQYSLVLTGCASGNNQLVDLASLLKYHLDGVIALGSDFEPEGLDAFTVKGIPIVQIGTGRRSNGIRSVAMDQEFGLDRLVAYLKDLGHRDIGYIGDDSPTNLRREQIVRSILKAHDLAIRPNSFVRVPASTAAAGHESMRTLLQRCGELLPTAVIAADDAIAQTGLRALFERRIVVPTDLSLAGIDDIPSACMTIPALTTLRQPIKQMIREAFRLLTNPADKSRARGAGEIAIRPELVIRESCAAPRRLRRHWLAS